MERIDSNGQYPDTNATVAGGVGRRTMLRAVGATAAAGLLAGRARATHEEGTWTAWGTPVEVGNAEIRTYATLRRVDGVPAPVTVGVWLPVETMQYLPSTLTEWHLGFPRALSKLDTHGLTYAGIDWNPEGHPPEVYSAPHFDVHFYLLDEDVVDAIEPGVAAYDLPAEQMPTNYVMAPVREIVPHMGEHLVDVTAPEFNGEPFTATYIYGAYALDGDVDTETGAYGGGATGQLTFVEPMVTRTFLETEPTFRADVGLPETFGTAGYYPTAYSVEYHPAQRAWAIALEDFEWFDA